MPPATPDREPMPASPLDIWILQTGENLPVTGEERLLRSGRLAQELARRGHSVTWWTSAFDHHRKTWVACDQPELRVSGHLRLRFLRGCGYSSNVSLRRYADHALVARQFTRQCGHLPRPDVLVINLPDHQLAHRAARWAVANSIPYILDLRDRWPLDIVDRMGNATLRTAARVALWRDQRMTAYALRHARSLVTMMEGFLPWGQAIGGRQAINRDRVFHLGAFAVGTPTGMSSNESVRKALDGSSSASLVVAYIGTMGASYNPLPLLQAARTLLARHGGRIAFIFAGKGDFYAQLESESAGLAGVHLTGWLDQQDVGRIASRAQLGVIPATEVFPAFPNKAFTYLSAGIPLVSMLQGEIAAVIEREGVGTSIKPGDIAGLTAAIERYLLHPEEQRAAAAKAADLFRTRYDARVIDSSYADHVEAIARPVSPPASQTN